MVFLQNWAISGRSQRYSLQLLEQSALCSASCCCRGMLPLSAQTEATSLPLELLLLIRGFLGRCFHALLSWREAGAVFHCLADLMCCGFSLCWWYFRAEELADGTPVHPALLLPALGSLLPPGAWWQQLMSVAMVKSIKNIFCPLIFFHVFNGMLRFFFLLCDKWVVFNLFPRKQCVQLEPSFSQMCQMSRYKDTEFL